MTPQLIEVLTGRLRPRHRRFHDAFARLCQELGLACHLRPAGLGQRVMMKLVTRASGIRTVRLDDADSMALLHQALNRGTTPYLAEFDLPLALHGYQVSAHRRSAAEARKLLESPQMRALLTFSDWARRSFALHYGEQVEAKCRTIYPLAFEQARCGSFETRRYDFGFISINFRTKCGPEAVRAFVRARQATGRAATLCVVTNLGRAQDVMGDLSQYPGVEWRDASQSEAQIAQLLENTNCLVHPSLNDSFGVVVLEALAGGCAVIATDIASFPELVRHGSNGLLIRAPTSAVTGDAFITDYGTVGYHEAYLNTLSLHAVEQALYEAMRQLLDEPTCVQSMMRASHVHFEQQFSRQVWQKRMRQILREGFPELSLS